MWHDRDVCCYHDSNHLQYVSVYTMLHDNYTSIKLVEKKERKMPENIGLYREYQESLNLEGAVNFLRILGSIGAIKGNKTILIWCSLFLLSLWDLSSVLQVQTTKSSTVKHQCFIKDSIPNKSNKSKEIIQSTKNVKCYLALRLAKSSSVWLILHGHIYISNLLI